MSIRYSADGQDNTRTLSLGATTQFAVSCWLKLSTDRNTYSTIWSLEASSSDYVILQTDSDGTGVVIFTDSNATPTVMQQLTVGTWYWIGVIVNGTASTTVIRQAGSNTFSSYARTLGSNTTSGTTLRIGESVFGSEWLDGCIAAFKLWNGAALTQAELELESWTYQPRRTANLRSWHPLTRAETTDYSGNGNTLSGGTGASTEDGPPVRWRRQRPRPIITSGTSIETTPSPIAAPWTLPAPDVSAGASVATSPIVAPWNVPTPDVTTAGSPPTLVQADPIIAPWSVPTPTVQVDVTVHASPIIAAWAVPAPNIGVPINPGDDLSGPGQISYNGFKMGDGTPYLWRRLTGALMEMPPIDNGNVNNPSSDGAQSGRKLPQPRVIVYEMRVEVGKDNIDEIAEQMLAGLPLPDADEELPFAYRVGSNIFVGRAAVVDRKLPIEHRSLNDGFVDGQVIWELSDPRLYVRGLASATIEDSGAVEVFNLGNRKTRPLLRIPGPSNTPHLEIWRQLGDGAEDLRVIEFNTVVPDGQLLTVDVERGTAELGDGTSLTRYLTGSVPLTSFVLGPGTSEVSYETADGDASPVVALWRHANL